MLIFRVTFVFVCLFLFQFEIYSSNPTVIHSKEPSSPYTLSDTPWADSVFNSLSLDERIAQLFLVAAYSNKDKRHEDEIAALVSKYNIGGLIFFQGSPVKQAMETNYFQSKAKTPLVIGMDAEWGLGMRLDSTIKFPRQMMLGALQDPELVFEMGEDIARQLKRLGVHINFAPVVDINNNPDNPVISNRSFGEDRQLVSSYSTAYMMGMQNNHIFSVAKHFPGHGDTNSDSHFNLPIINKDFKNIDSLELFPFKHLIVSNLGGIMIAHLSIPSLDSIKDIPSTLSKKVVTTLLRDSLNFEGLIFTDALNMGASNKFPNGEIEVRALEAGNDILVMANDIPLAIAKIKQAIASGRVSEQQINESCKKMLILKEWVGLSKRKPISTVNLVKDLNSVQSQLLNRRLVENALTVVQNANELIPVKGIETSHIAVVCLGEEKENQFTKTLDLYASADKFYLGKKLESGAVDKLISQLSNYNLIIVAVMNTNYSPNKNFGVAANAMEFLSKISNREKVILDIFAPPYFIKKIDNVPNFKTIIVSYEDNDLTQEYSAQLIFGGISAKGILPVSASPYFMYRNGISTAPACRFKYTLPEDIGISSAQLYSVDSIVSDAIVRKAMPGCQVFASKNGVVFYHKAFGYHTYDFTRPVQLSDIYDIASVTKVAATTTAVMKLYEKGEIKLNKTLSDYLPELKNTNKSDIVLLDVLTHQARLQPGIPFYLNLTIPGKSERPIPRDFLVNLDVKAGYNYIAGSNRKFKPNYFSKTGSFSFSNQVADSLYALTSYEDTIFNRIANSSLLSKKEYKYSDLGFMLMYKIVNKTSGGLPIQEYTSQNFYTHLGAVTLGYMPLMRFDKSRIVPTELDLTFRQQLIHGYVHDQTASLMGGVSGHAGLFSNANDLAKLFQMFLNGGTYGQERFLEQSTIDLFTSAPFVALGNRRGIGFDKPEMNPLKSGPTCYCVSAKSYGHSGFTGSFVWADPETGLLFVFLSNRIYPSSDNNKLLELSVRSKILQALTECVDQSKSQVADLQETDSN
jgi:beta-glucosidase-like glycosyl hydrolase/CubicO group peptidase (beta-lactamase class C family)